MEIYLIRHTTPDIAKGICYGTTDLNLADTFQAEAANVLSQLPDSFDAVYSSPLIRCSQLSKQITPDPIFDDRLKEMDFGEWELQPWDAIDKKEIQPWFDDWINISAKGGESYIQLYQRCIDFLESIKDEKLNRIAIIAHAGVIRAINAHIHNIPLEKSFELELGYGGVVLVEF